MSDLFNDLKQGLQEAIKFEEGVGKAKTATYVIVPPIKYSNEDIRRIRMNAGMTQAVFAGYLGVSKKTVEAWEFGRTRPTGPAFRLINLLSAGKAEILPFIQKTDA